LASVKDALTASGGIIAAEEHALYKDGARYFGLLHLNDDKGGGNTVVGIRNSHDKTFPAALALGHRVFVCDNLAFSGDVVVRRKHTRFIHRDLARLICSAVGRLTDMRVQQETRLVAYQGREIDNVQAHDLIIRALLAKIIGGEAVPRVVGEWREPRYEDFRPRTVWSLFNAFTEIMKGTNPAAMVQRTITLHGLFDSHCGILTGLNAPALTA
jgi:hypothetical protein